MLTMKPLDSLPPAPSMLDLAPHLSTLTLDEQNSILRVMHRDSVIRHSTSTDKPPSMPTSDDDDDDDDDFDSISLTSAATTDASSSFVPHFSLPEEDMWRMDGDLNASEWFDRASLSSSEEDPMAKEGPDLSKELKMLSEEEQEAILEVMRKDAIVQMYKDLKVR